jgi:DNA-binding response OmpR family regulator
VPLSYAGRGYTTVQERWPSPHAASRLLNPWRVTIGGVRVLVAEDEEYLADAIARGLRREGMAVDVALSGDDALDKALVNDYDVVVLDRDLPGVHGDDVCTRLTGAEREARILMLTAAAAVGDRVDGLSLGADDYLGKPFSFAELVARLYALARRPSRSTPTTLRRGDLVLDVARHEVTHGERALALTREELGVLQVLIEADGVIVSAEELLERVWDEHANPSPPPSVSPSPTSAARSANRP